MTLSLAGRWIALVVLLGWLLVQSHPFTAQPAVHAAPAGPAQGRATLLARFAAKGLPAGPATAVAWRKAFPAGFTSRHYHGGPGYIYVLSGLVQVSDSAGTRTYRAGDFFWEPARHVHTMRVLQPATLFVLRFLPPGAPDTVNAR